MAKEHVVSLLKGAGLAVGGALVAYAADAASAGAFGPYSVFVGAAASIALNVVRKLATAKPAP